MNFVAPGFLYALFFLAIPILIHLFNFRKYKTVYFSQVKFLKEVKKESQSASQLKHILILLSRLLALSAIIIAFAQPFGTNDQAQINPGKKKVQFYIDNSFSMQAKDERGILLESAKQKVFQIIKAYSAADEFQLLTNDFENSYGAWINKSSFIDELQKVSFSPNVKKISQVLNRFSEDFEPEGNFECYILSDLQENVFDINMVEQKTRDYTIIPMKTKEANNVALKSLSFEKPYRLANSQEELSFKLLNYGNPEADKSVITQLYINNKLKTPLSVSLGDLDSTESQLNYNNNEKVNSSQLVIRDFPIHFDDTLYFNFETDPKIVVSHLYKDEGKKNISAIYKNDSLFEYHPIASNEIDYDLIKKSSCLWIEPQSSLGSGNIQFLEEFTVNGGSIAMVLDGNINEADYNQLFAKLGLEQLLDFQEGEFSMKNLNYNAPLFANVFEEIPNNLKLPKSKGHYLLSNRTTINKEDLLTYQDNSPAVRKYDIGQGKLYLFNIPFSDSLSSFSRNALFVPILYNIALFSKLKDPLYYYLSDVIYIESKEINESPYRIVGNDIELIPKQSRKGNRVSLFLDGQIKKAGHYSIFQKDKLMKQISLNYDRTESNFSHLEEEEVMDMALQANLSLKMIESQGDALANDIQYLIKGEPYWKYFVILALIFLALEILLIRIL